MMAFIQTPCGHRCSILLAWALGKVSLQEIKWLLNNLSAFYEARIFIFFLYQERIKEKLSASNKPKSLILIFGITSNAIKDNVIKGAFKEQPAFLTIASNV